MPSRALQRISDLFSNVRFGIWLLVALFVYMTVGSAGIVYPTHPNLLHPDAWTHAQMRQWRPFELTEFEWFHWWPFQLLMGLLAANLVTTTLRRIPLRVVNLGVWMIHSGIIILIIGSVIYFGTKVEGDAPVARREVVMQVTADDGSKGSARLLASPGGTTSFAAGREAWRVSVAQIDPAWELRTGADAGTRGYSIMLLVEGPRGRFMRQVIADHPELSEDLILIPAGWLAANDWRMFAEFAFAAYLGIVLGDAGWFWMCRTFGTRVMHTKVFKRLFHPRRLLEIKWQIDQRGAWVLLAARFIPGTRTPVITMCGVLHMAWWKLLLVEGTCVLITAPLQMMIGWLAFHAAAKAGVTDIFHQIMVAVAVTLAVVIGLWIVHKWLDSRKSKKRPKRASVQWLRVFGRSRPLAAGAAHRG
jgi:membrane protein DedA with SNARE-associated domain